MSFAEFWEFPLIRLSDGNQVAVSQLVLTALFVVVGLFLARHVAKLSGLALRRRQLSPDAIQTAERVVFYSLLIVVVITALGLLNIPITAMAFATGAIAIGVGFGAQAVINNFISGWILMTERPVRIGDFIEIDSYKGVVERIGNRSTRIRRVDGVHMLVPNSKMLEQTVVNWTLVDQRIRSSIVVGVAYGSPVTRVRELLLEVMTGHAAVLPEPSPFVVFEDFGDSALIFHGFFWVEVEREMELRRIRSDMRFSIDSVFHENGVVIAFPQRDVHLDASQPIEIRMSDPKPPARPDNRDHE